MNDWTMRAAGIGAALGALLAAGAAGATDYQRVAIVGGDAGLHDFTDPMTALGSLASWCPAPSATAPCLIKILPGRYVVPAPGSLATVPYVDIEGSGQNVTVLAGAGGPYYGLVKVANGGELRGVTLEYSGAFVAVNGMAGTLRDVTVKASGTNYITGIEITGKVLLNRVTVDVSGTGPQATAVSISGSGDATLVDCDVKATTTSSGTNTRAWAVTSNGTTRILGSRLSASGTGTSPDVGGLSVKRGNTRVAGTQITVTSTSRCWAAYNEFDSSLLAAGTLQIDASQLSAEVATNPANGCVLMVERDTKTYIGASRLAGVRGTPWGTPMALSCVASYDGTNQPRLADCSL